LTDVEHFGYRTKRVVESETLPGEAFDGDFVKCGDAGVSLDMVSMRATIARKLKGKA